MTASIGGSIRNQQGDPIAGISVKLVHEPTASAFAKTSDASGQYQFDSVKVGGPYVLSVNHEGTNPEECKDINLKIDEVFIHHFTV